MSIYDQLLSEIFHRHRGPTQDEFEFEREEMEEILRSWKKRVKNLGDIIYSYRSGRRLLPESITTTGDWLISGRGKGRYAFIRLKRSPYISIPTDLQIIDILDATPDIILKYRSHDEQGLLTRIAYNRLVDTFLKITTYRLQGHLRAFVSDHGQIEVDDLYLGVDKDGFQYAIPVEAKTPEEPLGVVQIISQNAFAAERFADLRLRSIAIKAWHDDTFFFVEFNSAINPNQLEVIEYRRYRLVREDGLNNA